MTIHVDTWLAGGLALGFMIPAFIASIALGITAFWAFDNSMSRIVRRFKNQMWRLGK